MEAIVQYNYVAQEPDELTLQKGDVITEIKVMVGGWWEGTLRDKRGMFPDNFVKVLEPSATGTMGHTGNGANEAINSGKTEEHAPQVMASGRKICKVLFSYDPCNPDELTLVPGDSIEFLGEVEQGWWRGWLKGRVGVFPSNFVAPPMQEEVEKQKVHDKRELCRVLYPYKSVNEDELTLNEGDIITIISKDAPDEGWWKGELRGQVGLFPDNFVEIIGTKSKYVDSEQKQETSSKSAGKYAHQVEKTEKPYMKKNLDTAGFLSSTLSDLPIHAEGTKRGIATPLSSTASITSPSTHSNTGEKRVIPGHPNISNLKRHVTDPMINNSNGNTAVACDTELDGVERGEGAPLSHLTASRAKAPRRRPPSSQRLRLRPIASSSNSISTTAASETNITNGNRENPLEPRHDDDANDGIPVTARKKAPWAQELKLSHLEWKKVMSVDRIDKLDVKKERDHSRVTSSIIDSVRKSEIMTETKGKDKEADKDTNLRLETGSHRDQTDTPLYVPYSLYSQLLQRVVALEEQQAILQQTVGQLSGLLPSLETDSMGDKD